MSVTVNEFAAGVPPRNRELPTHIQGVYVRVTSGKAVEKLGKTNGGESTRVTMGCMS